MFCHKCGAKNKEENKFCSKCGAKLKLETEQPPQPQHIIVHPQKGFFDGCGITGGMGCIILLIILIIVILLIILF